MRCWGDDARVPTEGLHKFGLKPDPDLLQSLPLC